MSAPESLTEEVSGAPASTAVVEATGLARWMHSSGAISASGDRVASPAGQVSWAMYEWARNPYVLVITIYLFAPYFANEVVGGGVRGQGLTGAIQSYSGIIIAVLAPFLGAIADNGGRRKPWIALYTVLMAAAMLPMWFAMPHSTGWQLFFVGALIAAANVAFEFSAVFHNSLLPTIATPRGVAGLSGLGLALGNGAGIILLLFMLIAFTLPGNVP
ncbi:MAG: MFS transporter, partial [Alphaproteobacteria bacterium]|nr:MFS transporter [Alphaproteobacteria bacterium]